VARIYNSLHVASTVRDVNKPEAQYRASLDVLREAIRKSEYRSIRGVADALGVSYTGLHKQLNGYERYQMNASTLFAILGLLGIDFASFSKKVERRAAEDD
jgi:hypothetical protein